MKVSERNILKLLELPEIRLSHIHALEGVEHTRKLRVSHVDGTDTWYDDDSQPIKLYSDDEIELVPHANSGSQTHGPMCQCPQCTENLDD